jgi:hypothetical protein
LAARAVCRVLSHDSVRFAIGPRAGVQHPSLVFGRCVSSRR